MATFSRHRPSGFRAVFPEGLVLSVGTFRDGRGLSHKGKGTSVMLMPCAPLKVELKNLWLEFRKVVDYIQRNEKWLLNGYLQ